MELASLFIDTGVIIQFMDSLLEMMFGLAADPKLEEWSQGVIGSVAEKTESQVVGQIGYDPRE